MPEVPWSRHRRRCRSYSCYQMDDGILAVTQGGAVLLHATGGSNVLSIVTHTCSLVVSHVDVTRHNLALSTGALGEGTASDLVVTVRHTGAVHAKGSCWQQNEEHKHGVHCEMSGGKTRQAVGETVTRWLYLSLIYSESHLQRLPSVFTYFESPC